MKKLTLSIFLLLGVCSMSIAQQNLTELLQRYEVLKNTPLSEEMVLRQNFTESEIAILEDHFAKIRDNNVTQGASRVPSTFTVLDVRNGGIFGTLDGTPPFTAITEIANPLAAQNFCDDYDENGVLYGFNIIFDAGNNFIDLEFITIDDATGNVTVVGNVFAEYPTFPSGLSYDFTTSTMYSVAGGDLFTVDLTTGTPTLVGSMGTIGGVPIWLVIDNDGNAYTADITDDSFYTVDLTTGAAALVGSLGLDIGFAQDATIDPEDNTLYMAAYTGGGTGGVQIVDVTTGVATLYGDTGPLNAEFGMFSVAGVPPLSIDEDALSQISIFPNPMNDVLNVRVPSNVTIESASIFDVLGKENRVQVTNGKINVQNLSQGIYILNLRTSVGTLTQKVVKR